MADDITTTLRGRVGNTPQLRVTGTGQKTVRLRLAVSHWRKTDTGLYEELATQWYTIKAWGMLAQNVAQSVSKGEPVIVHGRVSVHGWLDNTNQVQTEVVLTAYSIGHDLRYGWTQFGGHNPSVSDEGMCRGPSHDMLSFSGTGSRGTMRDDREDAEDTAKEHNVTGNEPEATVSGGAGYAKNEIPARLPAEPSCTKVLANAISGVPIDDDPPF